MLAAMLSEHPRGREGLDREETMRSFNGKAVLPFVLALAASAAVPQHAFAQFFFRPFANIFRTRIPDEGPPAFASRPAVASILGRTGFQLVGPLGRRGDQIVATGVSRREGEMRFIIDPYEGRILRAVRLGPPPMYDRGPRYGGDYGPSGGDAYGAPPSTGGAPYPPPGAGGPGAVGPAADRGRQQPGGAALADKAPNSASQQRARAAQKTAAPKSSRAIAPTTKPIGALRGADGDRAGRLPCSGAVRGYADRAQDRAGRRPVAGAQAERSERQDGARAEH